MGRLLNEKMKPAPVDLRQTRGFLGHSIGGAWSIIDQRHLTNQRARAGSLEHKVAKDYGVVYDSFLPQINLGMGGVPKRSAFIVDKSGVIQYAESNDDAKQLPNFDKIKAKLAELK